MRAGLFSLFSGFLMLACEHMGNGTCFIVGEIGMNHMGDSAYGDEYLAALLTAKPNAVTFQIREKDFAPQQPGGDLYLPDEYYRTAADRVQKCGIQFGIALCDAAKLSFFEDIETDFYKILSKDIRNEKLVSAVLATGKPVYISTGMSDEEEIRTLLDSIGSRPNLSLIHTQLSYDDADTNLRAIARLRERFSIPVAFGLHATTQSALYAALGFAPSALFFYVRGNRPLEHRDQDHAVDLPDVAEVISTIRRLEDMMGSGTKKRMSNRIPAQQAV